MGSSRGDCTVEKDDRELPVGEGGVGVFDASVRKRELLQLLVPVMRMMQRSAHIVSLARRDLPSSGCWYPGSIKSPIVAQIFVLTPRIS